MERNMARLYEYIHNDLPQLPPDSSYKEWTSERALFYLHASEVRKVVVVYALAGWVSFSH